jgi:hypothetical protein
MMCMISSCVHYHTIPYFFYQKGPGSTYYCI